MTPSSSDESIFSPTPNKSRKKTRSTDRKSNNVENKDTFIEIEPTDHPSRISDIAELDGLINLEPVAESTSKNDSDTTDSESEIFVNPVEPFQKVKIVEIRDCLLMNKNNRVIFVSMNGSPIDKGAKEYSDKNKLPEFQDLILEMCNKFSDKETNFVTY